MTPVPATILDRAGDQLGAGLPRVAAALVLLVVGLLIARLLRRVAVRLLRAARVDDLAERGGVHDALERAGLPRSLVAVLGTALRVGLSVVVVFAAVSLLGLQFLERSLNEGILFLPRVLLALALVLAGVVVGGFARERVDRLNAQLDLPVPLGQLAQLLVIGVFCITALALIGVPTQILVLLLGVALGSAGLAFGLAFGLGNREWARAVSAGRFVRGGFEVGQTIAVAGVEGEITAIEPTSVLLRADGERIIRLPNHLLLEEPVVVRGGS